MTEAPPPDLKLWSNFHELRALEIAKRKLLNPGAPVFTIGSCFADEIRRALQRAGFVVHPDYGSIPYDQRSASPTHPKNAFMEHYDTFAIRQEFETAFGLWADRHEIFWPLRDTRANEVLESDIVFQDPARRRVYGKTPEALGLLTDAFTAVIRNGIAQAELIIITLGLTEVWQDNATGRYLCVWPGSGGGGGEGLATFKQSTFAENYANVKAILGMLFERYPRKQVLLTVSPVPLRRTFSNLDVGTANTESKSILRAVAGQISREHASNVTYYPAYEMATIIPGAVYQSDGLHVLPEFADHVVQTFMQAYS